MRKIILRIYAQFLSARHFFIYKKRNKFSLVRPHPILWCMGKFILRKYVQFLSALHFFIKKYANYLWFIHILWINVLKNQTISWFMERLFWENMPTFCRLSTFSFKKNPFARSHPLNQHLYKIRLFCDLWESLFWENMPNFCRLGILSLKNIQVRNSNCRNLKNPKSRTALWPEKLKRGEGCAHYKVKQKVANSTKCYDKVHIFWEGHKILRNLALIFDWHYIG